MFTPPSKDDVLWKYDSSATDVAAAMWYRYQVANEIEGGGG